MWTLQRAARGAHRRRSAARALVEAVESRLLLATVTWANPNGGDWDTASNWAGGKVPTAEDDVVIDVKTNGAQITHKETDADSAKSITSNQPIIITKGSLDLHGGDLSMSNTFTLHGGTILNATLVTDKGGNYVIQQPTSFNNVTLDKSTHITVPGGQTLNIFNTLRFSAGSTLTVQAQGAVNGQDSPQGGAAITGTGTINLTARLSAATISGEGMQHALIIGSKITINALGEAHIDAHNSGGLIIQGQLNVAAIGHLTVSGTFGTFTNEGTITVESSSYCTLNGNWANSGTIINNNGKNDLGTLDLSGIFGHPGTIKSPKGGKVTVSGTCNLDGKTLNLNSTTGPWILDGGTIDGGTIQSDGTNGLILAPFKTDELDDLNLDDLPVDIPSGADLSIQGFLNLGGGTTFNVSAGGASTTGGRIDFDGNETLPPSLLGTGTIDFVGAGTHAGILNNADKDQPLTIASGITIEGGDGTLSSVKTSTGGIVDEGSILPDIKGKPINLKGGPFTEQGTIFISTGATLNGAGLSGGLQVAQGGSLGGTGTYIGNVTDAGAISPGSPDNTGSFHIKGNLQLESSSTIVENLGGTSAGQYSTLNVTDVAGLAGKLVFETYGKFKPASGQTLANIMTYGSHTGTLPAAGVSPALEGAPIINSNGMSLQILLRPHLAFGVEPPATAVAGEPIDTDVVVKIENASGSVITSDDSTVTLMVASGPGTLLATAVAESGIATFTDLIFPNAGTYTLKAKDKLNLIIFSTPIIVVAPSD